ncbi:MAG: glycine--tRNA ligase subunit beta [Nitrospinae bacterium]|nr:glycine--tRNA ligase subunit beta [Nitrospinota bacterium]
MTWRGGARAAARGHGAALVEDGELATSVACLTEWPHALWGSFSPEYLELPAELLTASMKNHQRMFSAAGQDGKLTNGFIGVSNMIVEDDAVVVAGYRRVLAARLADAKFFFDTDRKKRLEDFAARLDGVVYQKKLGTVGEKIARFAALAAHIAAAVKPELAAEVVRVARLCKADLETQMVYEFPELQGVMGREYARHQGEPESVCQAIHEHYKPRFSGDTVPAGHPGAIVGLADRLDTLAGCFGVGLIPTGAADPFALRRAALGVIQTIIEKDYRLGLAGLFDFALSQLAGKIDSSPEAARAQMLDFFAARLKNLWTGQGAAPDVVDATLAAGFDDLAAARMRLEAMTELKKRDFFEPLAVAFKRAANITRGHARGPVHPALFEADAEKELNAAIAGIASEVASSLEQRRYLAALEKIAGLRGAVDRLFDSVMVMADDPKVRENRLNLLASLTALLGAIADFSRVEA